MLRYYKSRSFRILRWGLVGTLLLLLMAFGEATVYAQNFDVSGTVVSADDGTSLPGVNIVEEGTQNGTTTNIDGEFNLTVAGPDASLVFSFVGFEQKTVPVNERSEITVELVPSTEELEGVVVTALGIERQERSVGYATSQVEAEELVEVAEPNPIEMLQGKVPGMLINPNAGGVGSSSHTTIRGVSNLSGDNEPLYIVDGIPIINSTIGGGAGAEGASAGRYGGFDGGSPLSIINPENIQNISVLKGAGAAALYGTRARDGVILVNTKSGRGVAQEEFSVQYNSTLTARNALTGFANYQRQYGQGSRGIPPSSLDEAQSVSLSSWGAPFGEEWEESVQFDGVTRPYQDVVDRQGFYNTGLSFKNALSFNGAYENVSFRLSGSHLDAQSIVPSSGYQQTSVTLRGQSTFGDLTADANITYMNENTDDRTYLNDPSRNPNYLISFLPANVPKSALQPGYTEDGTELQYSSTSPSLTNPYWAVERFEADDQTNRILGGIQLSYDILDWLSVQGHTGLDWSSLRRTTVDPYGTAFEPGGAMTENDYTEWESNTRMMLSGTPSLTDDLSLRVDLGGNVRLHQFEQVGASGTEFNVPFFQDISNLANRNPIYGFSEQQVNSLFGSAAFNYSDYLFLTVTGRNDWSSTLPQDSNAFFYPSVSGSFVFSEALSMPDWMSYGKLRASWAEIGGDTSPYSLFLTYSLIGSHLDQPLGTVSQITVPNFELEPTSTQELELGFETQYFDDRFGIDFTWYRRSTTNQIIGVSVSSTAGYQSRIVNTGEVQNSGVELLFTLTPLTTDDLTWDANINVGTNDSEVISLAEGQDIRFDATDNAATVNVVQIPGEPVNAIYGVPYVRDDEGNIVHGENGLPLQGEPTVLGNSAPDWTVGLSNTFSYKNVSLNVLIDANWGGQLFSGTNSQAYDLGLHKNTLEGRQVCEGRRDEGADGGYPEAGCFVPEGVVGHFEEDEEGNQELVVDRENDVEVLPTEYYGSIGGRIAEEFVYDANFVKLRQLRISYRLPNSWMNRTPLTNATVSVVGRNLFYLYNPVPNVNPESSYNNAVTPGFEQAGVPQTRNIGFNLSLRL